VSENQYLEKYSQAKKEEKKLYKHRSENRKSFPNYNHFYVKKLKFTSRSIDLDFSDTLYNQNTSMEKSEKSSNCIFRSISFITGDKLNFIFNFQDNFYRDVISTHFSVLY